MSTDDERAALLSQLMQDGELTPETLLYRHTLPEFLGPKDDSGFCALSANPTPSEAVHDVYGGGHMALAEHVGPGLAWTATVDSEWANEDRVAVAMRLGDALEQGGLIYPAGSIVTDRAWYVTLPAGEVPVRRVEGSS